MLSLRIYSGQLCKYVHNLVKVILNRGQHNYPDTTKDCGRNAFPQNIEQTKCSKDFLTIMRQAIVMI